MGHKNAGKTCPRKRYLNSNKGSDLSIDEPLNYKKTNKSKPKRTREALASICLQFLVSDK